MLFISNETIKLILPSLCFIYDWNLLTPSTGIFFFSQFLHLLWWRPIREVLLDPSSLSLRNDIHDSHHTSLRPCGNVRVTVLWSLSHSHQTQTLAPKPMPAHDKTDTALLQNEKNKQTNKNQGEKAQVFTPLHLFPWENKPSVSRSFSCFMVQILFQNKGDCKW